MRSLKFISFSAAQRFVSDLVLSTSESGSEPSHIVWNQTGDDGAAALVSKILEDEGQKTKQFVILVGGPGTGKGFLTWAKFGEKFGLVNGKSMRDWLDITDISDDDIHEGDKILREIQRGIAIIVFNRLYNVAGGRAAFDETIKEVYYVTRDGERNELSDAIGYSRFMACLAHGDDMGSDVAQIVKEIKELKAKIDSAEFGKIPKELKTALHDKREELRLKMRDLFEGQSTSVMSYGMFEDAATKQLKSVLHQARSAEAKSEDAFKEFYDFTAGHFWKSMRGWQDDGTVGVERFKEAARREFEKLISHTPNTSSLMGGNIIVVDSPGEDVNKQPYVGQCAGAERAGYVTNIINLDPKIGGSSLVLMRLSNLCRNVTEDDRMVDDKDITGYIANMKTAVEHIKDNMFPDGPVHRYFHLIKDIENVENIREIFAALNGISQDKDEFVDDPSLDGMPDIIDAINKIKISINLAKKVKGSKNIMKWWETDNHFRKVIFGINPVVIYEMADDSENTDKHSETVLASLSAEKVEPKDYDDMLGSVEKWDAEYDEWTDSDTWRFLDKTAKETAKETVVMDFSKWNKINS